MLNIMDSSAVRPSRTLSPSNRRFPPSMSTPRAAAIPLLLLITLLAPADDRSASGGGGVRGAVAQTDCPLVGQGIDPYSAGLVDNKPPVYVSVLLKKLIAVDGTRATASSPNISAPLPHSPLPLPPSPVFAASGACAHKLRSFHAALLAPHLPASLSPLPSLFPVPGGCSALRCAWHGGEQRSSTATAPTSPSSPPGATHENNLPQMDGCSKKCTPAGITCCDALWIPSLTIPNVILYPQDRYQTESIFFFGDYSTDASAVDRESIVEGTLSHTCSVATRMLFLPPSLCCRTLCSALLRPCPPKAALHFKFWHICPSVTSKAPHLLSLPSSLPLPRSPSLSLPISLSPSPHRAGTFSSPFTFRRFPFDSQVGNTPRPLSTPSLHALSPRLVSTHRLPRGGLRARFALSLFPDFPPLPCVPPPPPQILRLVVAVEGSGEFYLVGSNSGRQSEQGGGQLGGGGGTYVNDEVTGWKIASVALDCTPSDTTVSTSASYHLEDPWNAVPDNTGSSSGAASNQSATCIFTIHIQRTSGVYVIAVRSLPCLLSLSLAAIFRFQMALCSASLLRTLSRRPSLGLSTCLCLIPCLPLCVPSCHSSLGYIIPFVPGP
ncbi:unnamed protein product [Closterium sp. NIES-53]